MQKDWFKPQIEHLPLYTKFYYQDTFEYQMENIHNIDETLFDCYPDPATMELMSKDGKTKENFQQFLDKTLREFDEGVVQANNELVVGVKDESFLEFQFLGKKVRLNFKEQSSISDLLAFSKLKSNLDEVVRVMELDYLQELKELGKEMMKCVQDTKLGKTLNEMFRFLALMLDRFQIQRVRKIYFPSLSLTDQRFSLNHETLIMLLDKIIITYTAPYINLLYATAYKLKPILSFYRPTTKPISLLDITLYSQELIMTYYLNGHPDEELNRLFRIVNGGKSYIDIIQKLESKEAIRQMIVFFKKYTYISDSEFAQVLKIQKQK